MKYVDEFRDAATVQALAERIAQAATQSWTLMEVCGGQTHAIVKHGLDRLLPPSLTLIHGPGCPVCVTPQHVIDQALSLAQRPEVIFCSFGDMLRVPGSHTDLQSIKAQGGDVRMVYSPVDAVTLAQQNPGREVVFFAVGFETTAPATALAARQAQALNLDNFSLLVAHVCVPPALQALLSIPDKSAGSGFAREAPEGGRVGIARHENRVQGLLAAGHVCAVMGYWEYQPIAASFQVPIVVTGFEPVDILRGVLACVEGLERGEAAVVNAYSRAVTREGNVSAQQLLDEVFEPVDLAWRGIGPIPRSGLGLKPKYRRFDAARRFDIQDALLPEPSLCRSGEVLTGRLDPRRCPAFGKECTPERPLGATMVSSEGACAAYYRYRHVH